jgi:phosphomannomutase
MSVGRAAERVGNPFKAYDIRGRVPDELDANLAWAIGLHSARYVHAQRAVVGRDMRLSGEALSQALIAGLAAAGAHVSDIGLCGTEEIYHATDAGGFDLGIIVTASHNPADHNGMKLVRRGAAPISGDTGLRTIERAAMAEAAPFEIELGRTELASFRESYIQRLLSFVDVAALRPLTLVANPGNGMAGPVIEAMATKLPFEWVTANMQPDGAFPKGVPNPLLRENRTETSALVRESGADFGVAWDGDFDRCFLFDETGAFVEGYYLVGLLARQMLQRYPGAKIIHDPRLTWNTQAEVAAAGGFPVQSKTGHAFIKERMRAEDAIYGGEMSAHHYFRDFAYCDSGMLPWLLVAELVSRSGRPLSALVAEAKAAFPISGEINRTVSRPAKILAGIEAQLRAEALEIEHVDGLSMCFENWRFNLRMSNTEPLLRLNVESRKHAALMEEKRDMLLELVEDLDN